FYNWEQWVDDEAMELNKELMSNLLDLDDVDAVVVMILVAGTLERGDCGVWFQGFVGLRVQRNDGGGVDEGAVVTMAKEAVAMTIFMGLVSFSFKVLTKKFKEFDGEKKDFWMEWNQRDVMFTNFSSGIALDAPSLQDDFFIYGTVVVVSHILTENCFQLVMSFEIERRVEEARQGADVVQKTLERMSQMMMYRAAVSGIRRRFTPPPPSVIHNQIYCFENIKAFSTTTSSTIKSSESEALNVHIQWWKEHIHNCKKKASLQLINRLSYINLLGLDDKLKNGSTKEGTLNSEILKFKSKFPREVFLFRVGVFYKAVGFDACILVEHAGLNPSGLCAEGVPKISCPATNLRQTLDDLTRSGFSACIVEETQGPTKARSPKQNNNSHPLDFYSGYVNTYRHAHPGSPYVFGLVEDDCDVDFPEPVPVIGMCNSYIRDLLLNPPTYATAIKLQAICKRISTISCADVPEFAHIGPSKLVKLLELKEANHIEFRKMKNMLDDVLKLHRNSELNEILNLLLDPTWEVTGSKIDLELLVNKCEFISCTIGDLIALDEESDQKLSSYVNVPSDFFEVMEQSWKNRIKQILLKEAYEEVDKAAEALSLAVSAAIIFPKLLADDSPLIKVTEDFLPVTHRIKASPTDFVKGAKGEILYARKHKAIWFKGKQFYPKIWTSKPGEKQIKELKSSVDSKGRKVGGEWFTTEKVEDALTRYHEANKKAKSLVLGLLRGLSAHLQSEISFLVFVSTLLIIAKALFAHQFAGKFLNEGMTRKWVLPTLIHFQNFEEKEQMDRNHEMVIRGLSPYWFNTTEGSVVLNDINMKSMFLLWPIIQRAENLYTSVYEGEHNSKKCEGFYEVDKQANVQVSSVNESLNHMQQLWMDVQNVCSCSSIVLIQCDDLITFSRQIELVKSFCIVISKSMSTEKNEGSIKEKKTVEEIDQEETWFKKSVKGKLEGHMAIEDAQEAEEAEAEEVVVKDVMRAEEVVKKDKEDNVEAKIRRTFGSCLSDPGQSSIGVPETDMNSAGLSLSKNNSLLNYLLDN
ncbi:hypothetical protein M8C21_020638, partial [Ambrosia artemisiifolia]